MIYVTVGTMFLDFPRLLNAVGQIAVRTGERTVVQRGMSATTPANCECFEFKPRDEVLALQRDARVIIAHAGIGSVMDALEARRPLIVVPRLKKFNEHLNDHQVDLAEAVERRGWGRMIVNMDDLSGAVAEPPPVPETYRAAKHRLVAAVRDKIERVAAAKPGP